MAGWPSVSVEAYWEPHSLAAALGWGPAFYCRYMTHCMVPAGPDAPRRVISLSLVILGNVVSPSKKRRKKKKMTRGKEILLMVGMQGPEKVKSNMHRCLPASNL